MFRNGLCRLRKVTVYRKGPCCNAAWPLSVVEYKAVSENIALCIDRYVQVEVVGFAFEEVLFAPGSLAIINFVDAVAAVNRRV